MYRKTLHTDNVRGDKPKKVRDEVSWKHIPRKPQECQKSVQGFQKMVYRAFLIRSKLTDRWCLWAQAKLKSELECCITSAGQVCCWREREASQLRFRRTRSIHDHQVLERCTMLTNVTMHKYMELHCTGELIQMAAFPFEVAWQHFRSQGSASTVRKEMLLANCSETIYGAALNSKP